MTRRSRIRDAHRRDEQTRSWAVRAARTIVHCLCAGEVVPATPYNIGLVPEPGEQLWIEVPARLLNELPPVLVGQTIATPPPIRSWLCTSTRLAGRIDDQLVAWRWTQFVGCRISLEPGSEAVALDSSDGTCLTWAGPGLAPLAVLAVWQLFGIDGLIGHPGLAFVRQPMVAERTPA